MAQVTFRMGGGLSTKADATAIRDDQLVTAVGCAFDTAGAVTSARGRSKTNTTALAGQVYGTFDAYYSGSATRIAKAGTGLYEDNVSIGTLSGTGTLSGVSYGSYAYLADGVSLKRWDGTTLENVGLDRPSSAPTATKASGGSMNVGTYGYAVTYYNGVAESNFSDRATVATDGSNQTVELTSIPVSGDSAVTERRIYRTDVDGVALYYLATISDNTTTTYTDTNQLPANSDSDASPGDDPSSYEVVTATVQTTRKQSQRNIQQTTLESLYGTTRWQSERAGHRSKPEVVATNLGYLADWDDHDKPPVTLTQLTVLGEQVWGVETTDNQFRFSLTGQPEHWPVYNAFTPGRGGSETCLTGVPLDRAMVCYTDAGVHLYSLLGLSYEDGRLDDMTAPSGLAGKNAVATVLNGRGHLYLGYNAIYLFDGQGFQEMSFAVEELFTDSSRDDYIHPDYMATAWMVAVRDKVFFSYGTAADNDRLMLIDLQDINDPKFSRVPFSATSLHTEQDKTVVGGTSGGDVYTLETGWSDDGGTVGWSVQTKDFPLGDTMRGGAVEHVTLDADFAGAVTEIVVRVRQAGTTRRFRFQDSSDGRKRIKQALPTYMRGETVSVSVGSADTEKRVLYGVGFGAEAIGEP